MSDADLGQFSEGFASWRQILGAVSSDDRPRIFANACADVLKFVSHGLDKSIAVDELTEIAMAYGLDTDEAQATIVGAFEKAPQQANGNDQSFRLIQSSAEFVKDFVPPDYLIEGILQRRFLYSFTGRTGSGKTAVVLLIAASVALGRNIGEIKVKRGRVLYFAGENPDDVRMRWIAMAQQMDFDPANIEVYFVPGRFKISEMRERIFAEMEKIGDVSLVIIDTSAAYYEGKEVNSNTEQAAHGQLMRGLVALPGGPCVLVNSHPVKNASSDNLLPLGAGAFLNEVDGNLTCVVDYPAIEVHWQGKFRGADFESLNFRLHSVTHEWLKNSDGKLIPTIVAKYLGEAEKEAISAANKGDRNSLLDEISKNGKSSVAEYAAACGFLLSSGLPHKKKTHNLIKLFGIQKLISGEPGDYALTPKGEAKIGKRAGTKTDNQDAELDLRSAPVPGAENQPSKSEKSKTSQTVPPGTQNRSDPDPQPITPIRSVPPFSRGRENGNGRDGSMKVSVRIVGDCPPETICLHCRQTDNVKRVVDSDRVGSKSETLHEHCAEAWFKKIRNQT